MSDLTSMGKQLKALMRETLENGVILNRPKFMYFKDSHDEMRDRLAIGLTSLLINTTYFDRATKLFISNMYMSKTDVTSELAHVGIDVCNSTVATRIRLDIERFIKDFGKTIIIDLFENLTSSVDMYLLKVEQLLSSDNANKCCLDSLRSIIIPVGKDTNNEISNERLDDFIATIAPYTEIGMRQVELKLDREVCGYVRRLLTNGAFGDAEEEHLEKLKRVLDLDINKTFRR